MSDGIVSIPCEDAGDGKVVVSMDDYRRAMEQYQSPSARFRKMILDAYELDPEVVGLNPDYTMQYTSVEPIFPGTWAEVGQSPLEWAHSRRGRLSIWFSNTRDSIGRRLYKIVSGRSFPTEDWWS